MPQQLQTASISAPALKGLNLQYGSRILDTSWATEADNCIFDKSGRIASRKGSRRINSTAISGEPVINQIFEHISGLGTRQVICSAADKIYKENGTSLTDVTGTITTPVTANWNFQNFNGNVVGAASGNTMIVATTLGGNFADITLSGTQQPTTAVNSILSAYGRLWALDGTDLKYSDLLDHTAWNGVFDLSKYWKDGMDEGVAIADWNNYLIVFGKNSIIIFNNPYDPASTMQIVDSIGGIGCIARDTVQSVAQDILFLSDTGVRSLGRTIQEKSVPIGDISANVKDYLKGLVDSETLSYIRSTYSEKEGFYILSFPSSNVSLVFDTKTKLEDGTYRVLKWKYAPYSIFTKKDGEVYLSRVLGNSSRYGTANYIRDRYNIGAGTGGYLSQYRSYRDEEDYDGTNGSTYKWSYLSSWTDFGEGVGALIKLPKKSSFTIGGPRGDTVTIKWGFDFKDAVSSFAASQPYGQVSVYGGAQFGVNHYSGAISFNTLKAPLKGSGRVVRFGVENTVDGYETSLQDMSFAVKIGRQAL